MYIDFSFILRSNDDFKLSRFGITKLEMRNTKTNETKIIIGDNARDENYIINHNIVYELDEFLGASKYIYHRPGSCFLDNIRDEDGVYYTYEDLKDCSYSNNWVIENIEVDCDCKDTFYVTSTVEIVDDSEMYTEDNKTFYNRMRINTSTENIRIN